MRARVIAAMGLIAVLAGACSSGSAKSATPAAFRTVVDLRAKTAGAYPEVRVAVKDNSFDPAAIRINPGTTVRWVNEGRGPHDIVASDKLDPLDSFGVGADKFKAGAAYEFRFKTPGVYRYYCS